MSAIDVSNLHTVSNSHQLSEGIASGGINVKENISELDTQIKHKDLAWNVIEGELWKDIPNSKLTTYQCDHTPEMLIPHNLIEYPKYHICIHRCIVCGEEIEEILPLNESDIN